MRQILLRPKKLDESETIRRYQDHFSDLDLPVHVYIYMSFMAHHFDALVGKSFYMKRGTIRHKSGMVTLPLGKKLLAYEKEEHKNGMLPRGVITIDYVVRCPLEELTEDEWQSDGFTSQEDMFHQMTRMQGRRYTDLKIFDPPIEFYKFKRYEPNPTKMQILRLQKAILESGHRL